MDISGSSINEPVSFYQKNTGNTINMAIDEDNRLYQTNIFAPEFGAREVTKPKMLPSKKPKRNKRLNTLDSDYLADEPVENSKAEQIGDNFFVKHTGDKLINRIKNYITRIVAKTPLLNYFFLKQKTKKIQNTVAELNNITRNVDDILNTTVPYGEETKIYSDMAKNLTNAASIIGKASKDI